jgi:murein DD-endopeptidase MepM/ murein hydrolase activator NlpD
MAGYIWPLPAGSPISQGFGSSPGGYNPPGGHTGIDFAVPTGTPVRAVCDGVIEAAGWFARADGGDNPWLLTPVGGLTIVHNAGPGLPSFVYAHLQRSLVKPGQRVTKGQIIAYTGNTSSATLGPHLHLEALPDGWNVSNGTYGRIQPGIYCRSYYAPPVITPKGTTTMATPKDFAAAVWATKIQQFNENGTKGSIQPAAYLFGNMGQWIVQLRTRLNTLLAGQAAQGKDIAAIRALLEKENTRG